MDKQQAYAKMIFDANCYFDFAKWQVALYNKSPEISGIISPYFSLDLAVFLFEAMAIIGKDAFASGGDESHEEFYSDLRIVRNNIHHLVTREKKFSNESERISLSMKRLKSVFKTDRRGLISLFTKDIGLTKAKTDDGDLWIASTLFPWFLLDRTSMVDENGQIIGEKVKDFNTYLAAFVKELTTSSNHVTEDAFLISLNLPQMDFEGDRIYHEDIKFSKLMEKTGFPLELTYTLLLIADEIGEHLFFTDYVINKSVAVLDDCTLYFLTKLLAIRYDEIFDTIRRFRKNDDYRNDATDIFDAQLSIRNIIPQQDSLRRFAKDLRNSIHYEKTTWCPVVHNGVVDYIPAFLDIVGGGEWSDTYLTAYEDMETQLKLVYSYLMEFFNIKGVHVNLD